MDVLIVILVVALAYVIVELRKCLTSLQQEKAHNEEADHDLKKLIELSDNTGELPVTQPEILTPEAVQLSFNIIRLICICSEGKKQKEAKL